MEQTQGNKTQIEPELLLVESIHAENIRSMMGSDIANIKTYLAEQQQHGNHFVAYPLIDQVKKEDLKSFPTIQEALKFSSERSTSERQYDFSMTGRLEQILSSEVEKKPGKSQDIHKGEEPNNGKADRGEKYVQEAEKQNDGLSSRRPKDKGLEM